MLTRLAGDNLSAERVRKEAELSDNRDVDVAEASDLRSSQAKAMDLASQIVSICLMPLLPGLGGYFLDQQFDTMPVWTVVGLCLGLAAAALQFVKLVGKLNRKSDSIEHT